MTLTEEQKAEIIRRNQERLAQAKKDDEEARERAAANK